MASDFYEIHQVEREELNEGWIWLRNSHLRNRVEKRRPIVLIKNERSARKVCCEILYADSIYLKNRHRPLPLGEQNLLILSAWYRRRLGIEEREVGQSREFSVELASNPVRAVRWQLRACIRHPQIAVVLSTVLAMIGIGLGFLGIVAIFKDHPVLALFGLLIILAGCIPLVLRARN